MRSLSRLVGAGGIILLLTTACSTGEEQPASSNSAASPSTSCNSTSLGKVTSSSATLRATDGSSTPTSQALLKTASSPRDKTVAGVPLEEVSQCSMATYSLLLSNQGGQSLGATFNPTRVQASIDAFNGTGVLLVSDRQQTDPQGGGSIGQLQGWTLDFQGATVGTYVWSSPVQWLDEQSKPHYGQVDLAVTIAN